MESMDSFSEEEWSLSPPPNEPNISSEKMIYSSRFSSHNKLLPSLNEQRRIRKQFTTNKQIPPNYHTRKSQLRMTTISVPGSNSRMDKLNQLEEIWHDVKRSMTPPTWKKLNTFHTTSNIKDAYSTNYFSNRRSFNLGGKELGIKITNENDNICSIAKEVLNTLSPKSCTSADGKTISFTTDKSSRQLFRNSVTHIGHHSCSQTNIVMEKIFEKKYDQIQEKSRKGNARNKISTSIFRKKFEGKTTRQPTTPKHLSNVEKSDISFNLSKYQNIPRKAINLSPLHSPKTISANKLPSTTRLKSYSNISYSNLNGKSPNTETLFNTSESSERKTHENKSKINLKCYKREGEKLNSEKKLARTVNDSPELEEIDEFRPSQKIAQKERQNVLQKHVLKISLVKKNESQVSKIGDENLYSDEETRSPKISGQTNINKPNERREYDKCKFKEDDIKDKRIANPNEANDTNIIIAEGKPVNKSRTIRSSVSLSNLVIAPVKKIKFDLLLHSSEVRQKGVHGSKNVDKRRVEKKNKDQNVENISQGEEKIEGIKMGKLEENIQSPKNQIEKNHRTSSGQYLTTIKEGAKELANQAYLGTSSPRKIQTKLRPRKSISEQIKIREKEQTANIIADKGHMELIQHSEKESQRGKNFVSYLQSEILKSIPGSTYIYSSPSSTSKSPQSLDKHKIPTLQTKPTTSISKQILCSSMCSISKSATNTDSNLEINSQTRKKPSKIQLNLKKNIRNIETIQICTTEGDLDDKSPKWMVSDSKKEKEAKTPPQLLLVENNNKIEDNQKLNHYFTNSERYSSNKSTYLYKIPDNHKGRVTVPLLHTKQLQKLKERESPETLKKQNNIPYKGNKNMFEEDKTEEKYRITSPKSLNIGCRNAASHFLSSKNNNLRPSNKKNPRRLFNMISKAFGDPINA